MWLAFKRKWNKGWGSGEESKQQDGEQAASFTEEIRGNKGRSQRKQGVRAKLLLQRHTAIPAVANIENSLSTLPHKP